MHVFSQHAVNTSVKYTISDMLCCQSVANSDFLPHLLFLGCCKNIVNSVVLFLVGAGSQVLPK